MTSDRPISRWRIPINGHPPRDLPPEWSSAIAAVSHDIGHHRCGRSIEVDHVVWELTAYADGFVHIGIKTSLDDADLAEFSRGAGFTLDTSCARAAVWIAETIQDQLAGHEFVQWPVRGRRLLTPTLRHGEALWVDSTTSTAVAPIGGLGSEPPNTI